MKKRLKRVLDSFIERIRDMDRGELQGLQAENKELLGLNENLRGRVRTQGETIAGQLAKLQRDPAVFIRVVDEDGNDVANAIESLKG